MRDIDVVRAPTRDHAGAELLAAQPAGAVVALADVGRLWMHAILGVVNQRRGAEPLVVIEIGGHGHFGLDVARRVFGQTDEDFLDLSDAAVANQLAGQAELYVGALLTAQLQDSASPLHDVGHLAAFGDGERRRLLQIDVLAGERGFHGGLRVPVVRRADADGVDALIGEHILVIGVSGNLFVLTGA